MIRMVWLHITNIFRHIAPCTTLSTMKWKLRLIFLSYMLPTKTIFLCVCPNSTTSRHLHDDKNIFFFTSVKIYTGSTFRLLRINVIHALIFESYHVYCICISIRELVNYICVTIPSCCTCLLFSVNLIPSCGNPILNHLKRFFFLFILFLVNSIVPMYKQTFYFDIYTIIHWTYNEQIYPAIPHTNFPVFSTKLNKKSHLITSKRNED